MENRVSNQIFVWLLMYLCFFAGVNLFAKNDIALLVWSLICILIIFIITIVTRFLITSTLILLPGFLLSCILSIFFIFNIKYSSVYDFLLQALSIYLMGFVQYSKLLPQKFIMGRPTYIYVHVGLNLVLFLIHIAVIVAISNSNKRRYRRTQKIEFTYAPRRRQR